MRGHQEGPRTHERPPGGSSHSRLGCFYLSVTHRNSLSLRVTHRKLFLLKVTGYPQKDVLVLMLPTQKRFTSKVPTENHNCLSLPIKAGFFEKVPTDERKRLGATHILNKAFLIGLISYMGSPKPFCLLKTNQLIYIRPRTGRLPIFSIAR